MNSSSRTLKLHGLLVAAALALVAAGAALGEPAYAQTASPTPTARAKAVIRNAAGIVKGTVYFSEYESTTGTNGHRIDVTGRITGLTPGPHGLHLWNGTCAVGSGFSNAGMHVDFTGEASETIVHPRAEGDLPNIVADSTGVANIRFTKFTNRFGLSSQSLSRGQNVFRESGAVAVGIDANPATPTSADPQPLLCGELACDAGSCDSSLPPPGPVTIVAVRGFPSERTTGELPGNAIDGDLATFTWTTQPFTTVDAHLALDFGASISVSRLRLWKDDATGEGGTGEKDLVILVTNDSAAIPLPNRTFVPVSGLLNGHQGTELMVVLGGVNSDGTVTDDVHDSVDDGHGFASLTFDRVQATGIAIRFQGPTQFNHYKVHEIEAFP